MPKIRSMLFFLIIWQLSSSVIALLFPFLPLVHYWNIFCLQLSLEDSDETSKDHLTAQVNNKQRTAVHLKASEAFLEAAPQFLLQSHIFRSELTKLMEDREFFEEWTQLPLVVMTLSFLSIFKACYDLQITAQEEKDMLPPAHPGMYLVTLCMWFGTTFTVPVEAHINKIRCRQNLTMWLTWGQLVVL